ncbi:DUF3307 domain-containing protein [Wenzhouxiangella sediminis]|uniref:DUF3307 domain-containing protein n=1 Tax=Wenzhouxiangella sediminis TaxID=1792836 RepID=A0A3E1K780_9GAMM|nr:DUF3307 domain-containing protein [Wenzhouxiangella sediminis]RFF29890.1 DUF3307 domain-containing protein [Wenzhouxiangella sediminis]
MQLFLALVIAHLLGDFVLQRRAVIDGKREGRPAALLEHGAWHLASLVAAWLLFAPSGIGVGAVTIAFAAIVLLHLLTDLVKYRLPGERTLAAFAVDQAVHVGVLVVAAWWLSGRPDWTAAVVEWWRPNAGRFGVLLASYLLVVVAFGWANRLALQSLLPESNDSQAGLARAGLYIGWLERFLMFSAVLIGAWSILGLVLAAKSVFRFDSIRKRREHAEYFVIGTLLSVSEVVAVGLALRWLAPELTGGS